MIDYPDNRLIAFRKALHHSDIDAMKKFASEEPELFRKLREWNERVVCDAARDSSPSAIRALIELGADVNEQQQNGDSALCVAVIFDRPEAAAALLESGADANLNCPLFNVACQRVSDRVRMARLLLDHGADVNQPYLVEGLPPRNVLSEAIGRGHSELVEFLKSRGAILPNEQPGAREPARGAVAPGDYAPEIVSHFRKHYGEPEERAIREIVPTSNNPVAVHYIPLTAEGNPSVLFTTGLSRVDLPVPRGAEQYRRAELMLELDKSWPRPEKALESPHSAWPIQWLRKIANYAASSGNWLGAGFTTLVDEDPPKPLAPGLKFTAWLLASLQSDDSVIHCSDGTRIQIYQLFPLYNEEYLYAREHGTEALMSLFVEQRIRTYIDLKRPNVAAS